MTEGDTADDAVPIPTRRIPTESLLLAGEDPRDARERVIREIIRLHPKLNDEDVLAALRGESGALIVSVPPEFETAAPLVAHIYQLHDLERVQHPERFRRDSR